MFEFEQKLGIANSDWLMSVREKLGIIGLLELLRPKSTIEFGYHRGGATKWLSKYSEKVITVDINEFVGHAEDDYENVITWNCPTQEAIKRIEEESLQFDLAIVDADHSRKAVATDVYGLLAHANIILMHDSCNRDCRRRMKDALRNQSTHGYNLDFITSTSKHDGLWGGLGLAYRSDNPGPIYEFTSEVSPYPMLALQDAIRLKPKLKTFRLKVKEGVRNLVNKGKILGGKLLGR